MGTRKSLGNSLPWQLERNLEIDDVIVQLVSELVERKSKKSPIPKVDNKTKRLLEQDFKKAQHGRSKAFIFDRVLAQKIGIEDKDIDRVIVTGPMKEWDTALRKQFTQAAGSLNDLGRSRILIKTTEQYNQALQTIMATKSGRKGPQAIDVKGTTIVGNVNNYLRNASKAGYAGSINFDIEIDLGKGRTGLSEVQIMPEAYEECYDHSHILYEMIRILKQIPKAFRTNAQTSISEALVNANQSLFYEHGTRTGFIEVRDDIKDFALIEEEFRDCLDILDRIRTALEQTKYGAHKRPPKWFKESLMALSYAKTSATNTFFATNKRQGCDLDGNEHG